MYDCVTLASLIALGLLTIAHLLVKSVFLRVGMLEPFVAYY